MTLTPRCIGPGFLIIAAGCFALMGMAVRSLVVVHGESVAWLGFIRFVLGGLAMLVPALAGAWSLRVHNRRIFILRGVIGAAGMALLYLAIAEVGLGRGTLLVYLMAVVAAIAGVFILGETLRARLLVAIILSAGGIFLVADGHLPHGAEWLALGGAVCSGLALVLIRLLRRTDSNQVAFFSQGCFGTLLMLPWVASAAMPSSAISWLLIGGMVISDIAGQLSMSAGLARTPVAQGASLLTLTPLFSLAAGYAWFGERLSTWQWLGCAVVLGAAVLAVSQRQAAAPEKSVIYSRG